VREQGKKEEEEEAEEENKKSRTVKLKWINLH